jgi:AraC-like DNA-binding protein
MTNLRLDHKRHSSINGDEDRLGRQIGKVNVAILNHHGRGGSNTKSFLKALSPSYVIYTSTRADITGSNSTKAASTLRYLRRTMKLPDSHIIYLYVPACESCARAVEVLDGLPEHIATDGALQPLFEELIHSFQSGQVHAKLQQNAVLMQILAELFALTHSRKKYCEPVRISMEYMQAHFAENVTLDTLGQITGYSCLHLLRLFERDTGQTPHKWLTAMRLNQSKHLLTESQLKVEEIAVACGFSSVSHFKTLFRQQTGVTPGQYRKNSSLL